MALAGTRQGARRRGRAEALRAGERAALAPDEMYLLNNQAEPICSGSRPQRSRRRLRHARGDVQKSLAEWRRAAGLEAALMYDEPPAWLYPSEPVARRGAAASRPTDRGRGGVPRRARDASARRPVAVRSMASAARATARQRSDPRAATIRNGLEGRDRGTQDRGSVEAALLPLNDVSPDATILSVQKQPMPPAGLPLLTYDAPLTLRGLNEQGSGSVRRPDRNPLAGHRAALRHVDHRDREILSGDVRLAVSIDELSWSPSR